MAYDWVKIKSDYFTTPQTTTLEDIAKKYNVNITYLYEVAAREKWKEEKNKIWKKSEEKLMQKLPETIADVRIRHAKIARVLQNKALQNLSEGKLEPRSYYDMKAAIQMERDALGMNDKNQVDELLEKFKQFAFIFNLSKEELQRFTQSVQSQAINKSDYLSKRCR